MNKDEIEHEQNTNQQQKRGRGRPAGSSNKTAAGALNLTTGEIIDTIQATAGTEGEATALIKEPTSQPGNYGKASSGRIYCPAEWIGKPALCLRLSPQTAAGLKAVDYTKKANSQRNLIHQNTDEDPET